MKNDFVTEFLGVLFILIGGCNITAQEEERVYRIGNSLTWDSQPNSIEQLAKQRDVDQTQAYHINCGKTLERIWTHPEELCVDPVKPYGTFKPALQNHAWDAVTIQPYRPARDKPNASTPSTDTGRFIDFMELARSNEQNNNTDFYIYCGWPDKKHESYDKAWTEPLPEEDPITTRQSREYFSKLQDEIQDRTDADVELIPVGEVLYELGQKAENGEISGYEKHLISIGMIFI